MTRHIWTFVDTSMNRVTRVSADSLDSAWLTYITKFYPAKLYPREGLTLPDVRKDLENDTFVLTESEIVNLE